MKSARKKQKLIAGVTAALLAVFSVFAVSTSVFADTTPAKTTGPEDCATFLKDYCEGGDKDIEDLIMLVADIMTAGIIVAGTIGIIVCGYTVTMARGNAAQIEKAKTRIFEIVIGLVAWVLGAALIHFLLPKANQADEIMGIIRLIGGIL